MTHDSIAGHGFHFEQKAVGFQNTGHRIKFRGKNGAFWGRLWSSFCLGLVESFLYGAYAGLVFVPIHNFLARRWVGPGMLT